MAFAPAASAPRGPAPGWGFTPAKLGVMTVSVADGIPLPVIWAVLFVLAGGVVGFGWWVNYEPESDSRRDRLAAVREAWLSNAPSSGIWMASLVLVVASPFIMGWNWQDVLVCSDWTRPQAALCDYEDIDSIWGSIGITTSLFSLVTGLWYLFYGPWA